jgi:hypothetical protein
MTETPAPPPEAPPAPPKPKRPGLSDQIIGAHAAAFIVAVNRDLPIAASEIVLSTMEIWLQELMAIDREAASSFMLSLAAYKKLIAAAEGALKKPPLIIQ